MPKRTKHFGKLEIEFGKTFAARILKNIKEMKKKFWKSIFSGIWILEILEINIYVEQMREMSETMSLRMPRKTVKG